MYIAFSYSGDVNPNRYTISKIKLYLILNNIFLYFSSKKHPPPKKNADYKLQ